MKKNIFFAVLFIAIVINIQGQSDFRKGYIINNQNDTVFGYIDYASSKKNSLQCVFKARNSMKADQKVYYPDEIKAYRFNAGKYYISRMLPLDSTLYFFEYLIDGIVDIFYYQDNEGPHFLIQKEGEGMYELKNEKKEAIVDGKKYEYDSKAYIGLLKANFMDSPETMDETEDIGLYHNDLIRIAEDYHNQVCKDGECIVFAKEIPVYQAYFGLLFGGSISKFAFIQSPDFLMESNDELSLSKNLNAGIFFNITNPLISERICFHGELVVAKEQFESENIDIELLSFKVPLTLQYSWPAKIHTPVFTLGFLLSLKDEDIYRNGVGMEKGKVQAGFIYGIGSEHKFFLKSRILFMLRGEYLYGDEGYYNSSINSVSFFTGIKF